MMAVNVTREKVAAYIKRNPEASIRQVQKACGLSSPSVARYHLLRIDTPKTICCPTCHGAGRVKPNEIY